jgi:hypothetical protein
MEDLGDLDLETAISAQLNSSVERRKFDRSRPLIRKAEKYVTGLGAQEIVLLYRPAVRTMIGEVLVRGICADSFSEKRPGTELFS